MSTFLLATELNWAVKAIATAVVSFAATNIDDIFILTLFFAQRNLRGWHIVLGQYLGLAALVAISLVGFFARFIIPETWIGLLGLVPIFIGIKKLIPILAVGGLALGFLASRGQSHAGGEAPAE